MVNTINRNLGISKDNAPVSQGSWRNSYNRGLDRIRKGKSIIWNIPYHWHMAKIRLLSNQQRISVFLLLPILPFDGLFGLLLFPNILPIPVVL